MSGGKLQPWRDGPFQPPADVYQFAHGDEPFMRYSTCSAADFMHPEFARISAELSVEVAYHRKLWEWVYIANKAVTTGSVGPGKRALVFAVGGEMMPAYFAEMGTFVTATDAPIEIIGDVWVAGGQYSTSTDNLPTLRMGRDDFKKMVEFRPVDMNNIPENLRGYDFCWSACSLEHLGSIQNGLDFIENTIKTLNIGGVSCHTTEFNCSSNSETVECGDTVLFRRLDLEKLAAKLREQGHEVDVIRVAPDRFVQDSYVDLPPYKVEPHLKLELEGHVATSIAFTVRRGR